MGGSQKELKALLSMQNGLSTEKLSRTRRKVKLVSTVSSNLKDPILTDDSTNDSTPGDPDFTPKSPQQSPNDLTFGSLFQPESLVDKMLPSFLRETPEIEQSNSHQDSQTAEEQGIQEKTTPKHSFEAVHKQEEAQEPKDSHSQQITPTRQIEIDGQSPQITEVQDKPLSQGKESRQESSKDQMGNSSDEIDISSFSEEEGESLNFNLKRQTKAMAQVFQYNKQMFEPIMILLRSLEEAQRDILERLKKQESQTKEIKEQLQSKAEEQVGLFQLVRETSESLPKIRYHLENIAEELNRTSNIEKNKRSPREDNSNQQVKGRNKKKGATTENLETSSQEMINPIQQEKIGKSKTNDKHQNTTVERQPAEHEVTETQGNLNHGEEEIYEHEEASNYSEVTMNSTDQEASGSLDLDNSRGDHNEGENQAQGHERSITDQQKTTNKMETRPLNSIQRKLQEMADPKKKSLQEEPTIRSHKSFKPPTIPHIVLVKPYRRRSAKTVLRELENLKLPHHIKVEDFKECKGWIEVKCGDGLHAEKLMEYILQSPLGQTLQMELKRVKLQKMLASNIPQGATEEDLIEALGINSTVLKEEIVILYKKKTIDNKENWTLLVPKLLKKHFQNKENYLIGFNKIQVTKLLRVIRCEFCQSLQHATNDCPKIELHCEYCSREHHVKGCLAEFPKCTNCHLTNKMKKTKLDVKHATTDPRCPYLAAARRGENLNKFGDNLKARE